MLLLKVAIFLPYSFDTLGEREKTDPPLAPFAPLFLAVNPLGKTLAEREKEHYLSVGSRRRPSGERSAFSFLPPQTPTLNNTESCLLFDPGRRWKRGGTKRKGSRGGGKQDVSDGGKKVLSKKGCGGKE